MVLEMKRWVAFGLWSLALAWAAVGATVTGVVYFDVDRDGLFGPEEIGAAGVAVTDGTTVVVTDENGRFGFEVATGARFVSITVPTGARAVDGWYREATESIEFAFPLESIDSTGPLVFVQLSDLHYAPTPEEFKQGLRDRRMTILPGGILDAITADVVGLRPDFAILTGDIVADSRYPDPSLVESWMAAMAVEFAPGLETAVYGVVGNHDVVRDETIGTAIYERYFGPAYYSFDVKSVHCVVLNLHVLSDTKLTYEIDPVQLAWLRQDLALVSDRTPVLVFCHEPTFDWATTVEDEALFDLLAETSITALVTGHWHTNVLLRTEPFVEWTTGAVCGAWWEGPGPDGTGFGFRVHRVERGVLDTMWHTAGAAEIEIARPDNAVLTWTDALHAQTLGRAASVEYRWDEGDTISLRPDWNGVWTSASAILNVAPLSDGYHDLTLSFAMEDGTQVARTQAFYVSNPVVSLAEIFSHPDVYRGKIVAANDLEIRAVMGSDISATDGTKTMIVADVPFAAVRGDRFGLVGMYHPTSVDPFKSYDEIFYTVYAK